MGTDYHPKPSRLFLLKGLHFPGISWKFWVILLTYRTTSRLVFTAGLRPQFRTPPFRNVRMSYVLNSYLLTYLTCCKWQLKSSVMLSYVDVAWWGGTSASRGGEGSRGEATTTEGGEGSARWEFAGEESGADEAGTGRARLRPQDPRTAAGWEQGRAARAVSEKGVAGLVFSWTYIV